MAALGACLLGANPAQAFEIDTGNPDAVLRWDNSFRYNLGKRTQSQDSAIIANPNYDDGDRNFDRGSLVANRLDILSRQLGKHPTWAFTFRGEPIGQVDTKPWTTALVRAGIKDFKCRDLRHTIATWHRQAGTPPHEL